MSCKAVTISRILVLQALFVGSHAFGADPATPLTHGVIFLQSFDAEGAAFLQGGMAHPFALEKNDLVPGRFGSGYQFEIPYENLLPPHVATPTKGLDGFIAEQGVALKVTSKGFNEQPLLAAETKQAGRLWQSQMVELKELRNRHRSMKAFLASVYLRASEPGVKVRLLIHDDIESTAWRQPVLDANAALLKNDPEARIKAPVATTCQTRDVVLATGWQRVAADIRVDTRRPVQQLRLELILLEPASAAVEASALQVERYLRFPDDKNYAAPWIPGGTRRESNALRMPLRQMGFDSQTGTLSCWVKLPPVDSGGSRSGSVCVHAGGGWWRPVWNIGLVTSYAGNAGHGGKYKTGQSVIRSRDLKVKDGDWHHLVMTWDTDKCALFGDGIEVGRAVYHIKDASPTDSLIIGASALDGKHCDAILDEVALWNRALKLDEIATLQARTNSLTAELSPWLMAYPERLVFHRGEAKALLNVKLLPLRVAAKPTKAHLQIPALGVRHSWRSHHTTAVTLHPWKAESGFHSFMAVSDDGAVAVSNTLEIIDELPSRDFVMLAWSMGADLKQYGFTAELTKDYGLDTVMRRGMLASLRVDARKYHPLDPATLSESLEMAKHTARRAAVYPNIYASMVNTEVSFHGTPDAAWFKKWMRDETGLDQVPTEIRYAPMRVINPTNELPAIISNSEPTSRFFRWMRSAGKGWPSLNAQIAKTMRENGLKRVMFYTDQPRVIADAQGLDAIDYWDYPHVSSGLVVDFNRVRNIAKLAGKKMSLMPGTIFWDPWPFHVKKEIVCLSPDLIRQHLWVTVASPLDHLGVYGMGEFRKGYVPPGSAEALRDTLNDIYPIGLMTGGLPQGDRKIAYLRTDGLHWYGEGDNQWVDFWFTRATTRALAEARIRFDMINDEHVEAGWLKHYDVVVLTGVERIPERSHKRLLAFLAEGGQLVVDRRCRADLPGATFLDYSRRNQIDKAVIALQAWAEEQHAASPEPLRLRAGDDAWLLDKTDGDTRFVFVVNDRMKPGHLGKELDLKSNLGASTGPLRDEGEGQRVVLSLPDADSNSALYNVRAHAALVATNGQVVLELLPGDATVLAVLPQPIRNVNAKFLKKLRAGDEAMLRVKIIGANGRLIEHRDLVEIALNDADGVPMALNRYHRVDRGKVDIPIRLPRTATPGEASVTITDWIAGKSATFKFSILAL